MQEVRMTRAMITALVLFLFPVHGDAKPDRDALACEEVKQEIRDIEARMRAGYSRAQGERYEARLRKLRRKRRLLCR
jgi:hypothetical protein